MHLSRQALSVVVCLCGSLVFGIDLAAEALTVEWDPPTDAATTGYIVLYGTASGVYSRRVDVGFATSHRVDGLADGTQYFFSVQAYSASGEVSALAAEIAGTTPVPGGAAGGASGGTSAPSQTSPSGRARQGDNGASEANAGQSATASHANASPTHSEPKQSGPIAQSTATSSGVPVEPGEGQLHVGAAADESGVILIDWPAMETAVGYRVEVGASAGETAYSAFTTESSIEFDTTGLPSAASFIRVRVVTAAGVGQVSNEATVIGRDDRRETVPSRPYGSGACVAPRAPRAFGAGAQGSAVRIVWAPGVGPLPNGYVLQVGSAPGRSDLMTVSLPVSTELHASAPDGTYALRLLTVNDCGTSVWGPETVLRVNTAAPLPGAPRHVTPQLSGDLLTLSWHRPADGRPVTRYLIEATTPFGPFAYDTGNPLTEFGNANMPSGEYLVTISAGNASGFGPPSVPVRVWIP